MSDSGWAASAGAWAALVDEGDPNRELLLDPIVLDYCGDVSGMRVLDAGCGEGRFARMLRDRGADAVALDATAALIALAHERDSGHTLRASADRLPFPRGTFGLVVSYLVLIDVADFRAAIREAARVLAPSGRFVIANMSFMSVNTGWIRDAQGNRLYYPIDDYFTERPVRLSWRGISIVNWHRPLRAYMGACLDAGLVLEAFDEPYPADDTLRDDPRYEDWYRVPNFVVMRWHKPGA